MRTRAARLTRSSLAVALTVSLLVHVASVAISSRGRAPTNAGLGPEQRAHTSESDLELEGESPELPQLAPAAPAAPAPRQVAPTPRGAPPAAPAAADDGDAIPAPAASSVLPSLPAPAAETQTADSQADDRGGPNSVGAQRQRLGGGAACDDAIAGIWRSSLYDGARGQWYVFTLTVHHEGGLLSGTIESKFWIGGPSSARAPSSCAETKLFAVVSMPAFGTYDAGRMRLGARSWSLSHLYCGDRIEYQVDRFSGQVDLETHELASIVTDGTNLVDQPLLFRRVSCLP